VKKHILVAEDHKDMADLYCLQLAWLGFVVTVARNGQEAVEIAPLVLPDLVIMDVLMPKMDGLKAARKLKENPATRNIPILAATAQAIEGDQEKCLAAGCDGFIAKPFTHKELGDAIDVLLKGPTGQSN
jgi:two-component system cell cycle response regulator DivK